MLFRVPSIVSKLIGSHVVTQNGSFLCHRSGFSVVVIFVHSVETIACDLQFL